MACYRPIPAHQGAPGEAVRLWAPVGTANLEVPCGKCIGCRTAKATEWAIRATHEASRWNNNIFLTLTYDDEHLPTAAHLVPRHLQLFLKRLRKNADSSSSSIDRDRRASIRFLACGEYGEHTGRPHYHLLLFNCGLRDRRTVGGQHGRELYTSETIARCWTDTKTGRPRGTHKFGEATPAAASYIAQYTLKKQGRPAWQKWHERPGAVYPEEGTGEWHERPEPFLRASIRPAIGREWLERYSADLQHGYLIQDGRRLGIPRYYQKKLKEINHEALELAEYLTQRRKIKNPTDQNDTDRRTASEIIHKRRKELNENRKL